MIKENINELILAEIINIKNEVGDLNTKMDKGFEVMDLRFKEVDKQFVEINTQLINIKDILIGVGDTISPIAQMTYNHQKRLVLLEH